MRTQGSSTELVRGLGLFAAFALVFGSMIGSGVFKKVSAMADYLGNPVWIILAWIVAGSITLIGALSNAEVAGLIAEPGGQYQYFKRMYGKGFAFWYGWSSFSVIQTATIASVAYVFAEGLNVFYPLPVLSASWAEITWFGYIEPFDNFGVKLVTIGLISLLTFLNVLGVRVGGTITSIMASSVVLCIILIIALSFGSGAGDTLHFQMSTGPQPETEPLVGTGMLGLFFMALMSAFWAYEGWNNIGFLGGEIRNPYRNIPRALVMGVGFVMLVYVLVHLAFLYIMPVQDLQALTEKQIAAVEVIRRFMGDGGALAISALIVVSTFNSTNTTILSAPRVYFAMAKDRLFFGGIDKVHPRFKSPSNALLIQAFWASILVMTGSFDDLTEMLIFAAFIFYGAGAFGVFVLRKKWPDRERPFKVPFYPFLPAAFVLFCLALVLISVLENPMGSLIGIVLMATGLPFYYFWRRNGGEQDE